MNMNRNNNDKMNINNNNDMILFEYAAKGNLQGLKQKLLFVLGLTSLLTTDDDDDDDDDDGNTNTTTTANGPTKTTTTTAHTQLQLQLQIQLQSNYILHLRDKKGSTLLHYAAGNGHVDVCRFLLRMVLGNGNNNNSNSNSNNNGNNSNNYVNIKNYSQQRTALHWSCRNGHLQVCQLLIQDGNAIVDSVATGNVTPLQLAVWQCHLPVCQYLVRSRSGSGGSDSGGGGGANKYYINNWGCSLYHWLGKSTIGSSSSSSSSNDDAESSSLLESQQNRVRAMCEWLDEKENENENENEKDCCLLWTTPNNYGQTPLHKAGYSGNIIVIQYILENNTHITESDHMNMNHRDLQGNTAADCAERNQQWEIAKYLRRYGRPHCLQNSYAILVVPKLLVQLQQQQQQQSDDDETSTTTTSSSSSNLLLLPIMSPSKPPPLSLSEIRRAYKVLVKKYHPDRLQSSSRRRNSRSSREGDYDNSNKPNNNDRDNDEIITNNNKYDYETTTKKWNLLQEAYTLWTLWWSNPNEADSMIRNLERHAYNLKQRGRELPLLILYHTTWHSDNNSGSRRSTSTSTSTSHNISDPTDNNNNNNNNNNHLFIETPISLSRERVGVVDDDTSNSNNDDDDRDNIKNKNMNMNMNKNMNKRQKIGHDGRQQQRQRQRGDDISVSSSFIITPDKWNELDDFERRLVRLLWTLPKQQIALSQLPKEYKKTYYDGQQHNMNTNNNRNNNNSESSAGDGDGDGDGDSINIDKKNIMINPKDYRCRKLGYLLEKYCSRTVEVIKIISSSSTIDTTKNNTKNAVSFTYWVKLNDTIQ